MDLADRLVSLQNENDLQSFFIHLQGLLRDYRQIDRIELLWNQVQRTEQAKTDPLRKGHGIRIQDLRRDPQYLVPLIPVEWQPENEQPRNAEARTDLLQVADWLITGWEKSTGQIAPTSVAGLLIANPYMITGEAPDHIDASGDDSQMENVEGHTSFTNDFAGTGRLTLEINGGTSSTGLTSVLYPASAATSDTPRGGRRNRAIPT
jgi:hypothetical protein